LSTNSDNANEQGALQVVVSFMKLWWVMPILVGLVLTGAVLLVTDFYPELTRFYSVF